MRQIENHRSSLSNPGKTKQNLHLICKKMPMNVLQHHSRKAADARRQPWQQQIKSLLQDGK
jgi:hypothetical protein